MNRRFVALVSVGLAVVVVALVLYMRPAWETAPPEGLAPPQAESPAPDPGESEPPRPVPPSVPARPAQTPPLPALDDSDSAILGALTGTSGAERIERLLVPEGIARKLVVTLDGLDRAIVPMKVRAIEPLGGTLAVEEDGEALLLSPDNYRRYDSFVWFLASVDTGRAADEYARYYPLLQQAYEEQGYPGKQFHDRVLEIIDHLLAAPEIEGPLPLVRPHVLYEYANPELESLSAGHKILLRMGVDNARALKAKLREIRAELVGRSRPLAGT